MSTITVAKKDNWVAIAADTQTTWDNSKDSSDYIVNAAKIIEVSRSYVGIAGATSLKAAVKHYFDHHQEVSDLATSSSIFDAWLKLHGALRDEYFLRVDDTDIDCVESSQMDALVANEQGIFGVSAHRAVQEFSRFYSYGSGREYAMGAMYQAFRSDDTSAEDVARIGVEVATEFAVGSSLPVDSFAVRLQNA